MPENVEDPVVRSARREAVVVFVVWLCALVYTVGMCTVYGYGRTADDLKFVFGFPDWVFWGIVAPWSVCFVVSWWFSYVFMTDEDLGEELEEEDLLAGGPDHGGDGTEGQRHG